MATIKDVARLAGVGVGTASRVVSGNGSVAQATAARVRAAIKELDFRPSLAARSLLTGSSQMIGVYIPVLKGTFYTPILQTIATELRDSGRHMVVAFGYGQGADRQQANEGIQFLMDRGCDGLMVISNALTPEDVDALGSKKDFLVVLNRRYESIAQQCFTVDHVRGGVLAAQTLLQLHHRKFAVIAGPATSPDNVDRIWGFMNELAHHGIDASQVAMLQSDFSTEGGWSSAHALVESGHEFTAVFCANDDMAIGVLSYFQQIGLSVPAAVSVLGYDDTHSAEYSAPRLTSVHVPWRDISQNGLHWLLNQYGASYSVVRDFPISITWRASVAVAKKSSAATTKKQVGKKHEK